MVTSMKHKGGRETTDGMFIKLLLNFSHQSTSRWIFYMRPNAEEIWDKERTKVNPSHYLSKDLVYQLQSHFFYLQVKFLILVVSRSLF